MGVMLTGRVCKVENCVSGEIGVSGLFWKMESESISVVY